MVLHHEPAEPAEEVEETDEDGQPNLSRRWLLRAAAVAPAVAVPSLIVASPAEAAYRGKIKRSAVMLRARNWYNRNIQYDMGATASDREKNHYYRKDCSGFISMCWHIKAPGLSTRTLPNIARQITWSALKKGDIVNSYDNHVMLFEKWDGDHHIWIYDLANPALDMRHIRVRTLTLKQQNYVPRRYKNIVNG
ncbi:hypothetical protein [Glycomyces salinus]|uniref:hypothetical protein n=1 Tax=Glycomyces salinus TaxID=980294 RepID=UPI0018EC6B5A|nr:hypothetical protein [Glycomyces salinus]